ncbi:MAG: hypothetical protein ACXWU1_08310 [Allosphingosinicella sp.]
MSKARPRPIAWPGAGAYGRVMALRLLRMLVLLSLALMPLRMAGAVPGTTDHHAAASTTAGHCAESDRRSDDRAPARVDCMIACACLPADSEQSERIAPAVPVPQSLPIRFAPGIVSGADPPPPRAFAN